MTPEKTEVLTLRQTAAWLQVSERTVLRMIEAKELPAFKVGRQWRFREQELSTSCRRWQSAGAISTSDGPQKQRAKRSSRLRNGRLPETIRCSPSPSPYRPGLAAFIALSVSRAINRSHIWSHTMTRIVAHGRRQKKQLRCYSSGFIELLRSTMDTGRR